MAITHRLSLLWRLLYQWKVHAFGYFALIVIQTVLFIPIANAETFSTNELKLKILYLYNFSKLTAWPAHRFNTPESPINICIYGDERYVNEARVLTKKHIKNHPITISEITFPEQVIACHTLFVSKNAEKTKPFLIQAYQHAVLTTGDNRDFIKNGGIIRLLKINNKIRFEINLSAIKNDQIKISSKLLRLAKTIHRTKVMN